MPKHAFQRDLPCRLLKAYTNLIIKSWLPTYRSSRDAASAVARSHSKQRHRHSGAGRLPRDGARWSRENCPRATAVCGHWAAVPHGAARPHSPHARISYLHSIASHWYAQKKLSKNSITNFQVSIPWFVLKEETSLNGKRKEGSNFPPVYLCKNWQVIPNSLLDNFHRHRGIV